MPLNFPQKRGQVALVVILLTALWSNLTTAVRAAEKPNIVFILADDMGLGDVGCYGGTIAPTPNIDRLAKEGTRFTQYYSASPICSPSRCGLITGQFPARWNVTSYMQTRQGNHGCEQVDFLDQTAPSLPRVLKESGYTTAHIGKWHLGGGRDVVNPPKFAAYGYDVGLGTYESPEPAAGLGLKTTPWAKEREPQQVARHERTRWMVDETISFLNANVGKSCFVNLWLDDTHTPWVPENAVKRDRANLAAVIVEMDKQIGRLVDAVPADTLVIFASDNGALPTFQRERNIGLRGSKLSLYEGGIRLPFIARWPGHIPPGRVDEKTVLHAVDMMPTLAAVGGGKLPDGYTADGEDVSAALLGESVTRRKPMFWEYGRNQTFFQYPAESDRSPNVAMRDGKWKFLVNADGTGAELYDVLTDPKEAKNVATDEREVAGVMTKAAMEWRKGLPKLP
jgi:arylsulfatase A-like enzyme